MRAGDGGGQHHGEHFAQGGRCEDGQDDLVDAQNFEYGHRYLPFACRATIAAKPGMNWASRRFGHGFCAVGGNIGPLAAPLFPFPKMNIRIRVDPDQGGAGDGCRKIVAK